MNALMKGIQQAIDGIETDIEDKPWGTKMNVLTLLLGTAQTIARDAEQQTKPKRKTVKQTVIVPKVKQLKHYIDEPKATNDTPKSIDDAQRLRQRAKELQAVTPNKSR